ncbi:MAG: hypothetical protein AAF715_22960 [Myxococcota bacterium]
MRDRTLLSRLALATLGFTPAVARAADVSDATDDDPPVGHALTLGVGTDNFRPLIGAAGYRLLLSPSLQVGVELDGGLADRTYISGYQADDGAFFGGRGLVQGTVLREGPLWLELRLAAGARYVGGAEARPESVVDAGAPLDESMTVVDDAGLLAHVEAGPYLTARMGLSAPVAVQVDPGAGLDLTGFVSPVGVAVHVSDAVSLTADGLVGGVFGWGGDGAKLLVRGQLGLRWLIGANTRDWRAF